MGSSHLEQDWSLVVPGAQSQTAGSFLFFPRRVVVILAYILKHPWGCPGLEAWKLLSRDRRTEDTASNTEKTDALSGRQGTNRREQKRIAEGS